jgi:hypothetical protein
VTDASHSGRKVRIDVAGAGLIGRRHAGEIGKSRSCAAVGARAAGVPLHASIAKRTIEIDAGQTWSRG